MRITSSILFLSLTTAIAVAQSAKPSAPTTAPKPAATQAAAKVAPATPAKPAPAASAKPASAAVVKSAPAAPAKVALAAPGKQATAAKPVVANAAATAKAKPVAKAGLKNKPTAPKAPATKTPEAGKDPEATKKISEVGKRDPFISPIVNRISGPTGCATGKKCLVVDQVRVQGIVRSQKGMIAMVINATNKTYFLYENDPVFNGYVSKITPDSIVFKETVQDQLGRPQTHEVVKKVNTPAV